MKQTARRSNLGTVILVLILVSSVFVLAGDVVVQEGVIEGEKFKSTDCTATGTKAVAFGYHTEASAGTSTAMGDRTTASGQYSTAMGYWTTAIGRASTALGWETTASGNGSTAMGRSARATGQYSTAMGYNTEASGDYGTAMGLTTRASGYVCSTAMGYNTTASGSHSTAIGYGVTAGPANYTTAIGTDFTNNVERSFSVGFGDEDFRVTDENVYVYGDLDVDDDTTLGNASTDTITCTGRWIPRTVAADPTSVATAGSRGEIVFYNDKWYGKTVGDGTDTNWAPLN